MIAPGADVSFLLGPVGLALLCVYGALSAVAFVLYGLDKAAAERGARRTPEITLHLVSLLGGWPGALLGQRTFRHKTRKQPFRAVFWGTVVINCLGLAGLALAGPLLTVPAAATAHGADPGATGSLGGRLALEAKVVGESSTNATIEVVCRNTSTRPATLTEGQDICHVIARRVDGTAIIAEAELRVHSQQARPDGLLGSSASAQDPLTAGPNRSFGGRASLALPGHGTYEVVVTMPGIAGLNAATLTVAAP